MNCAWNNILENLQTSLTSRVLCDILYMRGIYPCALLYSILGVYFNTLSSWIQGDGVYSLQFVHIGSPNIPGRMECQELPQGGFLYIDAEYSLLTLTHIALSPVPQRLCTIIALLFRNNYSSRFWVMANEYYVNFPKRPIIREFSIQAFPLK